MTPEGRVKAKVNRALDKLAPNVYRFMPVQQGLGAPALDYYICTNGWFIAIETKVKGKKLTPRQEVTKAKIIAAGGKVFTVDDDASLETAIQYITTCLLSCTNREECR
jgi:hypothetical protein